MEAAWGLVLGRLKLNLVDAIAGSTARRTTRSRRAPQTARSRKPPR
jgi:hypothetical protein